MTFPTSPDNVPKPTDPDEPPNVFEYMVLNLCAKVVWITSTILCTVRVTYMDVLALVVVYVVCFMVMVSYDSMVNVVTGVEGRGVMDVDGFSLGPV